MKPIFKLLGPHKAVFCAGLLALACSAAFNSALTGLVTPLMDDVLPGGTAERPSRSDELFGYREKLVDVKSWLDELGLNPDQYGIAFQGSANPFAWGLLVLMVFCFQALFDFLGTYAMGMLGLRVIVGLRQSMIDQVMRLSMNFFKRFNTGEILTRVNSDVLRVQHAISVKLGEVVKEATNIVAFTTLAFLLDWKLSLALFALVPAVGVPIAFFTRKIRKYAMQSQGYLGALTAHLKEVLVGIRIVKGFQKEGFESTRLEAQNRSFFKYGLRELKIVALTRPVMSIIGIIAILAFVSYGSLSIQGGLMTQGDFLVYILAVYQLYQPIKRIARANSEIQQAVGILPRIDEILQFENDVRDPEHPQRFEYYPQVREIAFEQVCFKYQSKNDAPTILRNISLKVGKGEMIALVGPSGSGKSSMVNLIPRFYDVTSGCIRINGLDIRNMKKADLRALSAIVTQDTILFDDTIFNNIAYSVKNAAYQDVERAAVQAFAHDFISKLPEGYQTRIGESGNALSGGQKQRLSIARAILAETPILILDEATSALDTESEHEIQLALNNLVKDKTTFVIAHRLSTIRKASTILVLNDGQFVEQGSHETLMGQKGAYYNLMQMQQEGERVM